MTYNANNIFYKIIKGTAPSTKIFENNNIIVIKNLYPAAPIHLLIIPRNEYTSYTDFGIKASTEEKLELFDAINFIINKYATLQEGYRLIANTGINGGQSVPHFHIHIIGGEPLPDIGL